MTNNTNPNTQDKPDLEHVLTRRRQTLQSYFAGMPGCKTEKDFEDFIAGLRVEYTVSKSTEDFLRAYLTPVLATRASGKGSKKRSEESEAEVATTEEESPKASEMTLEIVQAETVFSSSATTEGGFMNVPPPPAGEHRNYKKKV